MLQKNFIEDLSYDLRNEIFLYHIGVETIGKAMRVCKTWHTLFSDNRLWERKIIKDFHINQKLLSSFQITTQSTYKSLYARLYALQKNSKKHPKFIKHIYADKQKLLSLLLTSLDPDTALKKTAIEHVYALVILNIYAGNIEIPLIYAKQNPINGLEILNYAINANNSKLITELLKREKILNVESNYILKLCNHILEHALSVGNLGVVGYLLDKNNFNLSVTQDHLDKAARSGSLVLVKFLIDPANGFKLKPTTSTLNDAIHSGCLELIQYLLDSTNNFQLMPNNDTPECIIPSANLLVAKYLIGPDNKFNLKPTQKMLDTAANWGFFDLVVYLLDPKNKFGLSPTDTTLAHAAMSGSLELVKYLLNPENNFNLSLKQEVLDFAASNKELIIYLLDKKFGLEVTQDFLNSADCLTSELVTYLLDADNKFGLKPTPVLLKSAAREGNLSLVKYLIDLFNKFELKLPQDLLNYAISSENLDLVLYLINPLNNFNFTVDDRTPTCLSPCANKGISKHLIPSLYAIQTAREVLEKNDFQSAKTYMLKAHKLCPNYSTLFVDTMLSDPNKFLPNEASHNFVLNLATELRDTEQNLPTEITAQRC